MSYKWNKISENKQSNKKLQDCKQNKNEYCKLLVAKVKMNQNYWKKTV